MIRIYSLSTALLLLLLATSKVHADSAIEEWKGTISAFAGSSFTDKSTADVTMRLKNFHGKNVLIVAYANTWCVARDNDNSGRFYAFNSWWATGYSSFGSMTVEYDSADAYARKLLADAWTHYSSYAIPEAIDDFCILIDATHAIAPSQTTREVRTVLHGMAWRMRQWKGVNDQATQRHAGLFDPTLLESIQANRSYSEKGRAIACMLRYVAGQSSIPELNQQLTNLRIKKDGYSDVAVADFQWWIKGTEKNPDTEIRMAYESSEIERKIVAPAKQQSSSAELKYQAGLAYWYGIGVKVDKNAALELIKAAGEAGHQQAIGFMAQQDMKHSAMANSSL